MLWDHSRAPYRGSIISKRRSPAATGYIENLYALEADGASLSSDALEHRLNKEFDAAAAPVLDKLVTRSVDSLTMDEKRLWSRFLYLQLDRDPERVRHAELVVEEARGELLAGWGQVNRHAQDMLTLAAARNIGRGSLVAPDESRVEWENALAGWTWAVVTRPGSFITTDRPVLLTGGANTPGDSWVATIALSPDVLLSCTPPSWHDDLDEDWFRTLALTFNAALVSRGPRRVYSARPLAELPGPGLEKLVARYLSQ